MEEKEVKLMNFVRDEMLTVSECGKKVYEHICKMYGQGKGVDADLKFDDDTPGYVVVEMLEPGRAKVKYWISKEELEATAYSVMAMPFGLAHQFMVMGWPLAKTREIEGKNIDAEFLYSIITEGNQRFFEDKIQSLFDEDENITFDYLFDTQECGVELVKLSVDKVSMTVKIEPWNPEREEITKELYLLPFSVIENNEVIKP